MSRLILIPQYPTKLRYQEWWFDQFPKQYETYFDEILILGGPLDEKGFTRNPADFTSVDASIEYELQQINQFIENVELRDDDILLLNDLSFPGLFAHVLFYERPKKCFAICHATSKNRYDYFSKHRNLKYPIEKKTAKLFDKVFVATKYHANKLGWENVIVQPFPLPPYEKRAENMPKIRELATVSRRTVQKRTTIIEKRLQRDLRIQLQTGIFDTWENYYSFLSEVKILLITAKEETFGYQIIDAINNGCIPIAPYAFSYPEMLPKEYLYKDYNELRDIVEMALADCLPVPKLLVEDQSLSFYKNTSNIMIK